MVASKNWFPLKQAAFLTWAQNFGAVITPSPTTYGLVAGDATSYNGYLTSFESAFAVSEAPETHSPVNVALKEIARENLTTEVRRLYKKIRAANLSADKLIELGIPVPDLDPSPVPPPGTRPLISVMATQDRTVRGRVSDELTPGKRAKPEGVSAYEMFSFLGEAPPADLGQWKFEGAGTRAVVEVTFTGSAAVAGSKAWICARWVNAKGQAGPVSTPVSTFVGGGIAEAA